MVRQRCAFDAGGNEPGDARFQICMDRRNLQTGGLPLLPAIANHAVWEPPGDVEGSILFKNRHRLPAGESGLDFMPVCDGFLSELPAEADIVSAVAADEIDKADLIILQIAADLM